MINDSSTRLKTVAVGLALCAGLAGSCRKKDVTEGRYQGMVEYDHRDLSFEAPGRVVDLMVRRGQWVKAGEGVARQDDALDLHRRTVDGRAVDVAQADLDLVNAGSRIEDVRAAAAQLVSARAAEKSAEEELARQRLLVARGAQAPAVLEALQARLAGAVAERRGQEERLRALRKGARAEEVNRAAARVGQASQVLTVDDVRIERRTLTVPMDGIVQDIYIHAGEIAGAGVPVLSIADVKHPYADVFVPVPDTPHIKVGDVARLRVEGLPDAATGIVELIYPEAEFTPRFVFTPRERPNLMMRVRVRLDDSPGRLHAGLPAYATFEPGGARP